MGATRADNSNRKNLPIPAITTPRQSAATPKAATRQLLNEEQNKRDIRAHTHSRMLEVVQDDHEVSSLRRNPTQCVEVVVRRQPVQLRLLSKLVVFCVVRTLCGTVNFFASTKLQYRVQQTYGL